MRKQKDRLDAALPAILEGYCNKSPQPREVAEKEAKEFLQILEDSASYQFGYNHSIAYCLLGYLCGYYRYHHPLEFLTSFLNNAANDDDIKNGTEYARKSGIRITMPKWGISRSEYTYDSEQHVIAKGLSSVKHLSGRIADELYELSRTHHYDHFVDLLYDLDKETSINARQLEILIRLDFFSEFGNVNELLRINTVFAECFKKGCAKQIARSAVDGTPFEEIVSRYAVGVTKSGGIAKSYTMFDVHAILLEIEKRILDSGLPDIDDAAKVRNFIDVMGYAGYFSGKEEDRRKLYVTEVWPLIGKKDGKPWAHGIATASIGSGKTGRFTVREGIFKKTPLKAGDIIYCREYHRDGQYFNLTSYQKIA